MTGWGTARCCRDTRLPPPDGRIIKFEKFVAPPSTMFSTIFETQKVPHHLDLSKHYRYGGEKKIRKNFEIFKSIDKCT